jgi:hypothetical protein
VCVPRVTSFGVIVALAIMSRDGAANWATGIVPVPAGQPVPPGTAAVCPETKVVEPTALVATTERGIV